MVDATHKSLDASDRSYYAIIKKEVHALAISKGFEEKRVAELDIIVAEMTSNLHKYANGGELLLGYFEQPDSDYIELISLDNGPGMADLPRMMADGYSSTNTIGHGLGSIKRLSDQFDAFSAKGWGTVLVSRIYKTPPKAKIKAPMFRPIVVTKPSETTSGDGYYLKITQQQIKLLVADGLGHGPEANLAVNEAVKAFKLCPEQSPVAIIRYLHAAIRKTRGMVATVAVFDLATRQLHLAGVGNVAAKVYGNLHVKNHLSYNGIIGHNIPNTMNDQVLSFADYNQIVLCSDGIRSRWEMNKFPGLSRCDLSLQAAAIYKDYARRTDDMSVYIVKF